MPLRQSTSSFDRWMARSVRVLWWLGGGVCLFALTAGVALAGQSGEIARVLVTETALFATYVLMSRRITAGLVLAAVIGVGAAIWARGSTDSLATTWFVLVVGVGVAAYRAPLRHLPFLGVLAFAAGAFAGALLQPDDGPIGIAVLASIMTVSASIGGWRRMLRWQRERAISSARDTEREEIARELHDVVAHHVTALVVQAQAGQFAADLPSAHATLSAIEAEGRAAMGAMRTMVASLRGASVPTMSTDLRAELSELVTTLRATGVVVEESVDDAPAALAPTILRLTREAFTNVRRHAVGVSVVSLAVTVHPEGVRWSVTDDGRSTADVSEGGFGLIGLRERVDALGGHFEAGPVPAGWAVRAELPVRATA